MTLRIFSVAGEALHFGARRMETLMRVGWLPVALILVIQLATAYSALSVQAGRLLTFEDGAIQIEQLSNWRITGVAATVAETLFNLARARAFGEISLWIWAIFAGSFVLQILTASSLLAPMTRLAGLGEEPPPGAARLHFGEDEARFSAAAIGGALAIGVFIVGPMIAATFFSLKFVIDAYSQTFAVFPNPDSLHQVYEMTGLEAAKAQGETWKLTRGLPLLLLAPVAALFWVVLIRHFHPKNRGPNAGPPNLFARALVTLIGGGAAAGLLWLWVLMTHENIDPRSEVSLFFGFEAFAVLLIYYISLRLFPVAGVATCRRSFRSDAGSFLTTSRGFNLFRLLMILVVLSVVLFAVQLLINMVGFSALGTTVQFVRYSAGQYFSLFNNGHEPEWVFPAVVWLWTAIRVLYNVFWVFFSYGVLSGLLGRLYRDAEGSTDGPSIWMKR